jgi:hypothetical protein
MEQAKKFEYYYNSLLKIKEEISPSDFRFYNIAHLPLLIKNTLDKSISCPTCRKNIEIVDELIELVPLEKSVSADRKKFEHKKNMVENHLKKNHNMKLPGYYTSLGSFLGIILSGIAGVAISMANHLPALNDIIVIALGLGILIGRGIGYIIDKNIFHKNLQL